MDILAAVRAVDKHPHEYPDDMPAALRRWIPRAKAALQWPHFACPSWASLCPSGNAHLEESRLGLVTRIFRLTRYPYYLIGTDRNVCDIVVAHPSISRVHGAVVFHQERQAFVIFDLSTNGVRVDDARIPRHHPAPLPYRATVRIANSRRVLTLRREAPAVVDGPTPAAASTSLKGPSAEGDAAPAPGAAESAAPPPPPPPPPSRPFRHIVIKHFESAKPVSYAPRNRGEPVTRGAADAWALAHAVRRRLVARGEVVDDDAVVAAVEELSECSSAKRGGHVGTVAKGTMNAAWEAAAFALAPAEVSLPVETDMGVHLIYRVA